jgi:hypothetical protein
MPCAPGVISEEDAQLAAVGAKVHFARSAPPLLLNELVQSVLERCRCCGCTPGVTQHRDGHIVQQRERVTKTSVEADVETEVCGKHRAIL